MTIIKVKNAKTVQPKHIFSILIRFDLGNRTQQNPSSP